MPVGSTTQAEWQSSSAPRWGCTSRRKRTRKLRGLLTRAPWLERTAVLIGHTREDDHETRLRQRWSSAGSGSDDPWHAHHHDRTGRESAYAGVFVRGRGRLTRRFPGWRPPILSSGELHSPRPTFPSIRSHSDQSCARWMFFPGFSIFHHGKPMEIPQDVTAGGRATPDPGYLRARLRPWLFSYI